MAGEGEPSRGLLAWVFGPDVKVKGATDMATGWGLPVHKLPSVEPMWTTPIDNPIILSNALARKGIKHEIKMDAGSPTFGVATDRAGLWGVIKSILGL